MTTRAQLDAILAQLTTLDTQLATDVAALIAAIQAGQDFTPELNTVQAALTSIQASDTAVTGETGTLGGAPQVKPPV